MQLEFAKPIIKSHSEEKVVVVLGRELSKFFGVPL